MSQVYHSMGSAYSHLRNGIPLIWIRYRQFIAYILACFVHFELHKGAFGHNIWLSFVFSNREQSRTNCMGCIKQVSWMKSIHNYKLIIHALNSKTMKLIHNAGWGVCCGYRNWPRYGLRWRLVTAIRQSTSCAGRRATVGTAIRHNGCCAG